MATMKKDYYEILGVSRNASKNEIKKRYKYLVAQYHPDKHTGNPLEELAVEKFKEYKEAYEKIMHDIDNPGYSHVTNTNTNVIQQKVDEYYLYYNRSQWYQALEVADQLIRMDSNEPLFYVCRASVLYELNRYYDSLDSYKTALAYNWNLDLDTGWVYVLCLIEAGKYYKAIPIIKKFIDTEGEVPNLLAHLAYCLELAGSKEEAKYYWNKLELIDPNNLMLAKRNQSIKINDSYVSKEDAAAGACGVCVLLECLFDCC